MWDFLFVLLLELESLCFRGGLFRSHITFGCHKKEEKCNKSSQTKSLMAPVGLSKKLFDLSLFSPFSRNSAHSFLGIRSETERERGEERHQNSARGGGGGRENQTTDRRKKERDKRGRQENKIRQCFIASI